MTQADNVASEIYRRYGLAALGVVAVAFVLIWVVAHYTAAAGGNVSILWGLVQYTKEQSQTATLSAKATVQTPGMSEVVAHEIGFADAMVMGGWFRRTLPKPCIVRENHRDERQYQLQKHPRQDCAR